ncbi:MAG: ABC transporter ATP-binding protein [Parcubacteria group bacterium]|nr:ABC transporter ATP-binding protein [Parcubacteria group bacterium]
MKILQLVWTFYKKYPLVFILNILMLTFVCFIQVASTLLIAPVIDVFISPELKNISTITQRLFDCLNMLNISVTKINILILFLLFNALLSASIIVTNWLILKAQYAMVKSLAVETFNAFFNARWHFFNTQRYGSILNTLTREIDGVMNAFVAVGRMLSEFIRAMFFIAVPVYISWKITSIAVVLGCLFVVPFIFFNRASYRLGKGNTVSSNKVMELIHESLGAAKVILGYGNHTKYTRRFNEVFGERCNYEIKSNVLQNALPKIFEPFGWMVIIITMYISSEYFKLTVAEMGIMGYAFLRIIPMIGGFTSTKHAIMNFYPSYEQVSYMNRLAYENIQKTGDCVFDRIDNSIEYKDVSFSYPGHNPVLNDINITIKNNKMTAIVGESGSGKSTLIDLLIGFYEPDKGVILADKKPIQEFDIYSFRQHIGYIPQDTVLFNDTVKNNLLWSKEGAIDNEIEEACKLANADEFIVNLSDGYNTVVGERGVKLSGGERQRIALARALLRKPELLILDEATSALDSRSELLIKSAIENIAHKTTIVVIAHRLSTIINSDSIYVLQGGRIIEHGNFTTLINNNGKFKQIVELQKLVY